MFVTIETYSIAEYKHVLDLIASSEDVHNVKDRSGYVEYEGSVVYQYYLEFEVEPI